MASVVGDYIIGTGSHAAARWRGDRAVFVMQVNEVTDFDAYWHDPRFADKKPDMFGSRLRRLGDNVYHRDLGTGEWIQADSRHSLPNGTLSPDDLRRDTSHTRKVLLSDRFTYWGGEGPAMPDGLATFYEAGVRDKQHYPAADIAAFVAWVGPLLGQGYVGRPLDWPRG